MISMLELYSCIKYTENYINNHWVKMSARMTKRLQKEFETIQKNS